MTPQHALAQLLKLGALSFDDIVKYTLWTHEKTAETIESCKASGSIVWKHKPSRYAVPAMPKIRMDGRKVECLQSKMPALRGANMPEHAVNQYQQRKTGRQNRGEYLGLGAVWQ